jgi:hypothetical protein
VESLSALVEHLDGRLEIITWAPTGGPGQHQSSEQTPTHLQPDVVMASLVVQQATVRADQVQA